MTFLNKIKSGPVFFFLVWVDLDLGGFFISSFVFGSERADSVGLYLQKNRRQRILFLGDSYSS